MSFFHRNLSFLSKDLKFIKLGKFDYKVISIPILMLTFLSFPEQLIWVWRRCRFPTDYVTCWLQYPCSWTCLPLACTCKAVTGKVGQGLPGGGISHMQEPLARYKIQNASNVFKYKNIDISFIFINHCPIHIYISVVLTLHSLAMNSPSKFSS